MREVEVTRHDALRHVLLIVYTQTQNKNHDASYPRRGICLQTDVVSETHALAQREGPASTCPGLGDGFGGELVGLLVFFARDMFHGAFFKRRQKR